MEMIELDGGAGGGQLLRSALSLSLCTGIGFTMRGIRASRPRPGLLRQHLTAVTAAMAVGQARAVGAVLGATTLRFEPGAVVAGDYRFCTGGAGSTTLVLQTVLPALWRARAASTLWLEGGTHNPMAPSADFLRDTYLPALRLLGVEADVAVQRPGFYPAGGGALQATIQPADALRAACLDATGDAVTLEASVLISGLSSSIGLRELKVLAARLDVDPHPRHVEQVRPALGPGNVVRVRVSRNGRVESFDGHGERGLAAERVAERLAARVHAYVDSGACVGEHLADQLLLPMALGRGGEFTTHVLSDHLTSNARLIEKFLPVEIDWQAERKGLWRVRVAV